MLITCAVRQDNGIIGKHVTIHIKFKVIGGRVKQHLLSIFQMLPHRQFAGGGIFAHQRFEDLIVVVAPAQDAALVDMLVEFEPVGIVQAMQPHFFDNGRQRAVLSGLRNAHVKLHVH